MNGQELARSLFEVLASGDAVLAAAVVADDFTNREANSAPPAAATPGPAGVLASGAWMRSAFSELRFDIEGVAETGDEVWVRLRMRGIQTGPFVLFDNGKPAQVLPPSGREIDFEQLHMLKVRDGKVVGHEAVRDDLTMLSQLGAFPPSPAAGLSMAGWKLTGRARRAADEVSRAAEAATRAHQAVAG